MKEDKLEKWTWPPPDRMTEELTKQISDESKQIKAEFEKTLKPIEHLGPEDWLRDIR
jgi:hypothetical protein